MRTDLQGRVQAPEIIQFGDPLEKRMSHIEIVAQRWTLLELSIKHVFAIIRVGASIKRLLGAIIQAGDSTRGVQEGQGDLKPRGIIVRIARAEKTGLVVIIEEGHQ